MKTEAANRRRHVRYRDEESTVIQLEFESLNGKSTRVTALIVNESHSGFACVYVGSEPIQKGKVIHWNETSKIKTPLKVIRCKLLQEDTYSLALELVDY